MEGGYFVRVSFFVFVGGRISNGRGAVGVSVE